ncbi:MAG: hypothetical protein IKQ46_15890 [Bacteroidales bacterium]|jgi:uncharacterized protein YxjI|nr:hypothetical protein [Bacteroidales bacterium]
MENLFEKEVLVVNQKFTVLNNEYQILAEDGSEIGFVKENTSVLYTVLKLFLSNKMLPWSMQILDSQKNVLVTLSKGLTFWMPKISITNSQGVEIATIKRKFGLKPKFEVLNTTGNVVASVIGDFIAWDFVVYDAQDKEIGKISKKFGGVLKELFTDSDKYMVNINNSLSDKTLRAAVIAASCVIDKVLKERD